MFLTLCSAYSAHFDGQSVVSVSPIIIFILCNKKDLRTWWSKVKWNIDSQYMPCTSITTCKPVSINACVISKNYILFLGKFLTSLQMFRGVLQGSCRFSLQYLWKRAVRITEKPYTPQRERLCMLWGNPVIFTDCGEIL